jgi:hypothetical protein
VVLPFVFAEAFFGVDLALNRNAGLDHSARIAGNERMPPGERPPRCDQPIGTCRRKPIEFTDIAGRELDAIRNPFGAVVIVAAAAASRIEKLAGKVGEKDAPGVLILELDQAASPAAVAERLPLLRRHFEQRLRLPEGLVSGHRGDLTSPAALHQGRGPRLPWRALRGLLARDPGS